MEILISYLNDSDNINLTKYLYKKFAIVTNKKGEIINSEENVFENLREYSKFSDDRKNLILSRLKQTEESTDMATIFTGIGALFLAFLGVYTDMLKTLINHELISKIGFIIMYALILFSFARKHGESKRDKAKAKYLYELLSKY